MFCCSLFCCILLSFLFFFFFFFNDTATTEIYTLSLHDALPISQAYGRYGCAGARFDREVGDIREDECRLAGSDRADRSEEHTSELQSLAYLVCRLLLEKKKKKNNRTLQKE